VDSWYYAKGDVPRGPVPFEKLRSLVVTGEIAPADLVWTLGFPEWKPASQVAGLVPAALIPPAIPCVLPSPLLALTPSFTAGAPFASIERKRRIVLLVAASVVIVCFFTPLFYVSVRGEWFWRGVRYGHYAQQEPTWSLSFGWNLWYGIATLLLGVAALGVGTTDLVLQKVAWIRVFARWSYLLVFSLIALCSLLGVIMNLCGSRICLLAEGEEVPMSVIVERARDLERAGVFHVPRWQCMPICAFILIGAATFGLVVSVSALLNENGFASAGPAGPTGGEVVDQSQGAEGHHTSRQSSDKENPQKLAQALNDMIDKGTSS
jgi:hypothetical protein